MYITNYKLNILYLITLFEEDTIKNAKKLLKLPSEQILGFSFKVFKNAVYSLKNYMYSL